MTNEKRKGAPRKRKRKRPRRRKKRTSKPGQLHFGSSKGNQVAYTKKGQALAKHRMRQFFNPDGPSESEKVRQARKLLETAGRPPD